ncbi:MAG: xylulokinase, partial [Gammaproteobacteria bacterium]|nr:xylulokinase [Gammaproteobacteria bacterium]
TTPERAMLSLGTSGVYFVATPTFTPAPNKGLHTFCHCLPDKWHQMGVILSAASCVSWWRNITNSPNEQDLIATAATAKLKDTPIFLPYLSGERTPHNDPFAQGLFFGMTHNTGQAEFTQAVLEGVAFAIFDCQTALKEVNSDAATISITGGGAKSKYWGQIIANILNKPLHYHDESVLGPAFGAALLARMSEGAALIQPQTTDIITPQPEKHDLYMEKFIKYRKLYQKIKNLY